MSSVEGALTETTNFLRRSLQTERTEEHRKEKSRMEGKHGSIPLKREIELKLYIQRFRILNGQLSGREQNECSSINSVEDQ